MSKYFIWRFCVISLLLYLTATMFSCNTTKKIKYFQDIPDSGKTPNIPEAQYKPLIIRTGDILSINIETIDPLSTSMINSVNAASGSLVSSGGITGNATSSPLAALAGAGQASQPVSGYIVDNEGNVDIPIIGKVKAAGYTTDQLKNLVYNQAIKYFKEPTVIIRFANFKVSVLGEVLKPGQYIMPDEKESILDAIAMAGDLTIFGKRENVLLIRDNLDGTKTTYRVNLKKSNIMDAPYYYLRQNDVIYVEPRSAKSDANDASQARYVSIAASVLSVLIIIATRIK